jgi:hypothetical protein
VRSKAMPCVENQQIFVQTFKQILQIERLFFFVFNEHSILSSTSMPELLLSIFL